LNNKRITGFVACLLALCFLFSACLTGCATKGKKLLSLGKNEISVNIYQLMLTQQKGNMAYAIYNQYGNYNSEAFWGIVVDAKKQWTNAQYYDDLVLTRAKNYLCAMALFDELESTKSDFEFPKAYEKSIDAAIQSMIDVDAGGSKTKLNSILSEYGVNINMLREYLIMDAKSNYVVDYLYGSDGSKISDAVKEQYYEENYVSCKQILLQKYYYVYETDDEGNLIYFSTDTRYPIYDTTKTPKYNSDGTSVVDEYGNRIYYNSDGSIAYDTVNGITRIVVDEMTGEEVYRMYSDEKIAQLKEQALKLAAEADGKGINAFEALRIENSGDYQIDDETGGMMYYDTNIDFSTFTMEFIDEITDSLEDMEIGEVKLLESDLSYNIIIKTELENEAWNKEKYSEYFSDKVHGIYDFITNVKIDLYTARLAQYADRVVVDEKAFASIDFSISNVSPNFYYPDPDVAYYLYTEE